MCSFWLPAARTVATAAAIVPAVVAARGARLQTKAQQGQRTDDIARLLPRATRSCCENFYSVYCSMSTYIHVLMHLSTTGDSLYTTLSRLLTILIAVVIARQPRLIPDPNEKSKSTMNRKINIMNRIPTSYMRVRICRCRATPPWLRL